METYDAKKSANDVRQGNRRQMNMRVLVISTIAIIVMFALLYFVFLQPGLNG